MDIKFKKLIRYERYIFALVLTVAMVAIAEISGEKDIIFPEIVALTIGAWVSEKQQWVSNKRKIFILLSLASFAGVFIVRYMHAPMFIEVCTGFLFTGIALSVSKTNLLPVISACILPVYLQITSFVYPVSVTIMALIIIAMQWIMEKQKLKPKNTYVPCEFSFKTEFLKWSKLLFLLGLFSFIPIYSKNIFFMAPPLIVTFTALANPDAPIRKNASKIWAVIVLAGFTGALLRIILGTYLHLPLAICAILACIILFIVFEKMHTLFPPAGAILLIPMILTENDLKFYPFEVLVGASVVIPLTILIFRKKLKPIN